MTFSSRTTRSSPSSPVATSTRSPARSTREAAMPLLPEDVEFLRERGIAYRIEVDGGIEHVLFHQALSEKFDNAQAEIGLKIPTGYGMTPGALVGALFARTDVETAAYLRCGISQTNSGVRLLVREVIEVGEDDYLRREANGLSIASRSYVPVIKRARTQREAFVLVHTHPRGPRAFSEQDDHEEQPFFQKVHERIPEGAHGSMVLTDPTSFAARRWLEDGRHEPIERIVIIGRRFRLLS